jgi:hypothetical protein
MINFDPGGEVSKWPLFGYFETREDKHRSGSSYLAYLELRGTVEDS